MNANVLNNLRLNLKIIKTKKNEKQKRKRTCHKRHENEVFHKIYKREEMK